MLQKLFIINLISTEILAHWNDELGRSIRYF
jgi:hypothetical protein